MRSSQVDINNFQRVGSISNAHAGSDFEKLAQEFFAKQGITRNYAASVGAGILKKDRKFDLGSDDPPVLVECKSHTWTQGGNIPSAKLTVWNEAMYYFHIAPKKYRKILFVLKHKRGDISLASYYLANYRHLVPDEIEIWEYCTAENKGDRLQ
jgi:hypothetical protein